MDKPKKDGFKIAQFEWFEVQTKVRQYVYDLLQPFQKKQIQDTVKMNQIKKQVTAHKQKIHQHSFLLGKSSEKPVFFAEMEQKLKDLSQSFMTLKSQQKQNIQDFKVKLATYDDKMYKMDSVMTIAENERRLRITDKQEMNSKLQKQMKIIMDTLQQQSNEIAIMNASLKTSMHGVEEKVLVVENKFKGFQSLGKSLNNNIQILKAENIKIDEKNHKNFYYLGELEKKVVRLEQTNDLSKKFMAVVNDLRNEFSFIETYIDKYLPLFIQGQISDTLNSCIVGKARKSLCLYQQKVLSQFNEIIMRNDSSLGLAENIQNYINTIEKIILRNKKYVIKLKVEKRVRLGNKQYDMHILENQEEEEQQDVVDNRKLQQPYVETTVPEDKIKTIVQRNWKEVEKQFRKQLNREIGLTKVWLKQAQEVTDMKITEVDSRIEKNSDMIRKIETDIKLELNHFEKEQNSYTDALEQLKVVYQDSRALTKELAHFSSIINHIIIQDQIDRQGIALYGLRETSKDKDKEKQKEKEKPNVSIDSKCFSCSGFPASTLSAFKMACLAYNPSNVFVEGKLYKRQQILELATKILQNIKEKMNQQKKIKVQLSQREKIEKSFHRPGVQSSKTIQTPRRILPTVSQSKDKRDLSIRRKDLILKQSPANSFYF